MLQVHRQDHSALHFHQFLLSHSLFSYPYGILTLSKLNCSTNMYVHQHNSYIPVCLELYYPANSWKATENSSNWQETSRNPLYVFLPDGSLHNPLSYKPPLPPMSRMSDPPYDHYLLQHPTTDDHDRQQIQALSDNLQNHKLLFISL